MKKILLSMLLLGALGGGIFYALTIPGQNSVAEEKAIAALVGNRENGKYMFYAGGCASCHAKPAKEKCDEPSYKDAFDLSGGRCLKTPFGRFNVPNISSDPEFGIGKWTDQDFVRAMRRGVSPKGKHYYPAFPYTSYQSMSLKDLVDLKSFLNGVKPQNIKSVAHDLKLPFRLRRGLGLWKKLYLADQPFRGHQDESDQVSRGRYLVEGAGHCLECHSPRSFLGGIVQTQKLSGGPALEGKGRVPNLTPHKTGLKSWSAKDIAYSLESGFTPEYDVFGGAMTKVQENMAHLTAADRLAIGVYLKSLKPIASGK